MKSLEFLSVAKHEYARAVDWYLNQSVSAANRFSAEVDNAIEAVLKNPDRYGSWDETYRFYLLKKFPYFVAYRTSGDRVVIVAIRHSSQDQDAWKGR